MDWEVYLVNKKKYIISLSIVFMVLLVGCVGLVLVLRKPKETPAGNKANIEWYTEDGKEFVISTVDELYGLVKLSNYYDFSGQIIKLGADLVVNEGNAKDWGTKPPAQRWYPIDGFAGEFDGQGHSISGIYGYGAETAMGLFSNTKGACKIKDFKLLNSYFEVDGTKPVGSIVAKGCGTLEKIYSDAIVTSNGGNSGGIVGRANDDGILSTMAKSMKVFNCWFDGTVSLTTKAGLYGGGIAGQVYGGTLTIAHCLNTGTISTECTESSGSFVGGLFGGVIYTNFSGTVTLDDNLSVGKIQAESVTKAGSVAGSIASKTTCQITNTFSTEQSFIDVCNYRGGSIDGGIPALNEEFVNGEEWFRWTTLDYDQYWTLTKDSTPVLSYFADEVIDTSGLTKAFSLDWYNETAYEQIIRTKEDLYGFALLSYSNTFTGKVVTLGNDIVVNEGKATDWEKGKNVPKECWIPISRMPAFQGVFDGKGHTISGLYGPSNVGFTGLFGWTGIYSEIKNVNIKNSYFACLNSQSSALGSVAGRVEGQIDTVYSDAILSNVGITTGGIAGYKLTTTNESTIKNCWYAGTIHLKGDKAGTAGGILGRVLKGNITLDNCLFNGDIYIEGKLRSSNTGGLTGRVVTGTHTIKGCLNDGEFHVVEAEKMNSMCRVIGQINDSDEVKVVMEDSYFTIKGDSPSTFYYCAGNKPTIIGGVEAKTEESIKGYNGYITTSLDFEKYWTVVVNQDGTPILRSFAKKTPSVAGLSKIFDKSWYDAEKKSYVLTDAKDLYGLMYLSNSKIDFKGKTVTLANDIQVHEQAATDWAQGKNIPESVYNWSGIGKYTNFHGIFDGQGHTISGLYGTTDTSFLGLFGVIGTEGVVKNLSLKNSYFETVSTTSSPIGSVAGRLEGQIHTVYSDAILVSQGLLTGGIAGYKLTETQKSKITNCWYDGIIYLKGDKAGHAGGILGRVLKGNMTLDNCLFSGKIQIDGKKTRSVNTGGFVGNIASGELTIKTCLNTGKFEVTDAEKMNSLCRVIGQIVNKENVNVTLKNIYFTTEGDNASTFYYCAGDKPSIAGLAEAKLTENIMGYGGFQTTALDFKNYWTVVVNEDGTPILKSFTDNIPSLEGYTKNFDKSWYDAKKSSYVLTDAKDLYGLLYLSNSKVDFKGKTISLGKNIVVNKGDSLKWSQGRDIPTSAYHWSGIGKYTNFHGTFDGQGRTISGLYGTTDTSFLGLFSVIGTEGVVKNLSLKNSYFETVSTTSTALGSVTGRLEGQIHTVYSDAILASHGSLIGGIAGYKLTTSKDSNITNCWYAGTICMKGDKAGHAGGILGRVLKGNMTLDNCLFSGKIQVGGKETRSVNTGGFVGNIATGTLNIQNCLNTGELKVTEADKMNSMCRVIGQITSHEDITVSVDNVYFTTIGDNATSRWYRAPKEEGSKEYLSTLKGNATAVSEDDILGEYGYFVLQSSLDFGKYWTTVLDDSKTPDADETGTPVLQSFASVVNGIPQPPSYVDISWYDEEATDYTIYDANDLMGVAYLSKTGVTFKGKTIKVADGITEILVNKTGTAEEWAAGTSVAEYVWEPIGWRCPFEGIFDGNKTTISGICGTTDSGAMGLFAHVASTGVVQNFRLTNTYFENATTGEAYLGSIAGHLEGSLIDVYSDALIQSSGRIIGGLAGSSEGDADKQITNCWYAGTICLNGDVAGNAGGILGRVMEGTITLDNCLFSGEIEIGGVTRSSNTGGFVGYAATGAVNLQNCLNTGELDITEADKMNTLCRAIGQIANHKDVVVTVNNVYFTTIGDNATSRWYRAPKATGSKNYLSTLSGNTTAVAEADILGKYGFFVLQPELDFDRYWTTVLNDTPVLKLFAEQVVDNPSIPDNANINWYGGTNDYAICKNTDDNAANVKELYGFAYLVNQGITFEGQFISLGNDVTINPGETKDWDVTTGAGLTLWTPIGNLETMFAGTFNGNGKAIRGIYATATTDGLGLFAAISETSSIRNLKLENSYFRNTAYYTGSIVGQCAGSLHNVYSNATVAGGVGSGGLLGKIDTNSSVQITECWFDGELDAQGNWQGGIVGRVSKGTVTLKDCLNTGDIDCNSKIFIGGILGSVAIDGGSIVVTMDNCLNYGEITAYKSGTSTSQVRTSSVIGNIGGNDAANGYTNSVTVNNVYTTTESYSGREKTAGIGHGSLGGNTVVSKITLSENALKGFDFKAIWEMNSENVPVLQWVSALEWYNELSETYSISTRKELYGMVLLSHSGVDFEGKTIRLDDNITWNDKSVNAASNLEQMSRWTPIGTVDKPFAGMFDGNGKTIYNIYASASTDALGLFAAIAETSLIKNLNLKESYFTNTAYYTGSIVGQCAGSLQNVYSNATVAGGIGSGGLIGKIDTNSSVQIMKCWFDGNLDVQGNWQGGIVGRISKGTVTMKDCLNTGDIDCNGKIFVGGICGQVAIEGGSIGATMENCLNYGEITDYKSGTTTSQVRTSSIIGNIGGNDATNGYTNSVTANNVYTTAESYSGREKTTGIGNGSLSGDCTIQEVSKDEIAVETLKGFDFDTIWVIGTEGTPKLNMSF